MTQDSLPLIVSKLLQKNNIAFDKAELTFQIQSHPSYPSLHAITGVLDHFNIENVAASIPANQESLAHLPDTFIAQIENDLAVVSKNKTGFSVQTSTPGTSLLEEADFVKKFTGVVVAVEKGSNSELSNKYDFFTTLRWSVTGLTALVLLYWSNPNLTELTFLALSLIGVVTSFTILRQESGQKTTLGNALCSDANEKKDCDAVLNSKGAKLWGNYKFSDLSLIYFLAMALTSFWFILQSTETSVIEYASLLALPITFYSIYYQWRVVKKWCLLCLGIVTVLWVMAGFSLMALNISSAISPDHLLFFCMTSLITLSGWHYLKPKLDQLTTAQKTKVNYFRFKRNFNLFSTLLNQSDPISTTISDSGEIVFGHKQAPTEITIVTNPFCSHCKAVHSLTEDILNKYPDLVTLKIRFNINPNDEGSDLIKITIRLLEIYQDKGAKACLTAMSEIYGDSTAEDWLAKWGESKQPEHYLPTLERGREWCEEKQIHFTPEILVNGRSYPKEYDRPDLIYFIEDLEEESLELRTELPEELLEPAF